MSEIKNYYYYYYNLNPVPKIRRFDLPRYLDPLSAYNLQVVNIAYTN